MEVTFAASAFPPLALGFFGLGTGYLIYGPQELAGWPKRDDRVDRASGVWGVWQPRHLMKRSFAASQWRL